MKPFVKTTSSIAMLLMLPIGTLRAENSVPDGYSLVQVPDDAVIQLYHVTGTAISFPVESSEEHYEANYIVSVAIDNDEIYIQGLFQSAPDAWIKGFIKEDAICFDDNQYLGLAQVRNSMSHDAWFLNKTTLPNAYFSYNRESGRIAAANQAQVALSYDETHENEVLINLSMTNYSAGKDISLFEQVTPPAEADAMCVDITANLLLGDSMPKNYCGKLIRTDRNLYIQGLCPLMPEAWVKGEISEDGNTASFTSGQYLGIAAPTYYQATCLWFDAFHDNRQSVHPKLIMTIDPVQNILTTADEPGSGFIENTAADGFIFLEMFADITITPRNAETTIQSIPLLPEDNASYDLMGRKQQGAKGLSIERGRIVFKQ